MIRRPPRSTLFPYTTLFRSRRHAQRQAPSEVELDGGADHRLLLDIGRPAGGRHLVVDGPIAVDEHAVADRKSTRLNSSHLVISYAVFCLKKKTQREICANRQ